MSYWTAWLLSVGVIAVGTLIVLLVGWLHPYSTVVLGVSLFAGIIWLLDQGDDPVDREFEQAMLSLKKERDSYRLRVGEALDMLEDDSVWWDLDEGRSEVFNVLQGRIK